jgi:hypothetical protein
METTTARFSFKHVLATLPLGTPVSTRDLETRGITAHQASYLARQKWLTHLGRGAYIRAGDKLVRDACIAFLANRIEGLHVGGEAALAWRGVVHNVAFKEKISLWGDTRTRLPAWFTAQFSCNYQVTQLFSTELPSGYGLQSLPNASSSVLVSVPERALLEMLSDVGKTQSLEEAVNISEGIQALREPVLDQLLKHCTRIKVVRLLYELAQNAGQSWAGLALEHSKRIGGGKRWQAFTRTGERIDLGRP